jgi:hypothetical protein
MPPLRGSCARVRFRALVLFVSIGVHSWFDSLGWGCVAMDFGMTPRCGLLGDVVAEFGRDAGAPLGWYFAFKAVVRRRGLVAGSGRRAAGAP